MERSETSRSRKEQTRSRVYQYLYRQKGFCSKQTIANDLNLSLPTVYQNVTELMGAGLIQFSGEQQSTGGRRASGIDIVSDARVAVGISVTATELRMSVADLRLNELCFRSVARDDKKQLKLCEQIAVELERFLNDNNIDRKKLLGVGIAMPAVFDASGEHIVLAPTLHKQNSRLCVFDDMIPYPVYVQNDAKCAGLAECFVRGRNKNMVYLSLQDGVGGALLPNGQLNMGDHLRGGEFGHMCVQPEGKPCACGRRGCLEAYCSPLRITDELGVSLDEFFGELETGNREYGLLWQDMLKHLAIGVSNINLAFDCDIIMGGSLSEYMEPWLGQLRRYAASCNPFDKEADFVQLSMIKSHSVSLGAALHFIKQFTDSI